MDNHAVVDRLRSAALEIAAAGGSGKDLTVAALCTAAGISQETYHRVAPAPIHLLADAVNDQLLARYDEIDSAYTEQEAFFLYPQVALEHVVRWTNVYTGELRRELRESMRQTLAPTLRALNEARLRERPDLFGIDADDEDAVEFIAAFLVGGAMAAIEVWIAQDEPDIGVALDLLRRTSPPGWLTPG